MCKEWLAIEAHNAVFIDNMTTEEFEAYVEEHIKLMNEYDTAMENERVW